MNVSYHAFVCSMMQMAYSSLSFESIHVNLNFSLKSYYLLKITFISGIVNLVYESFFLIFIMSYYNVLNEENYISEFSTAILLFSLCFHAGYFANMETVCSSGPCIFSLLTITLLKKCCEIRLHYFLFLSNVFHPELLWYASNEHSLSFSPLQ